MSWWPFFPHLFEVHKGIVAQEPVFPDNLLLGPSCAIPCNLSPFSVIRGIIGIRVWYSCIGLMASASCALGGALRCGRHTLGLRLPLWLRLLFIALFRLRQWVAFRGLPRWDIEIKVGYASTSPRACCLIFGDHLLYTGWQGTSTPALSLVTPAFGCLRLYSWLYHCLLTHKKSCQLVYKSLTWGKN